MQICIYIYIYIYICMCVWLRVYVCPWISFYCTKPKGWCGIILLAATATCALIFFATNMRQTSTNTFLILCLLYTPELCLSLPNTAPWWPRQLMQGGKLQSVVERPAVTCIPVFGISSWSTHGKRKESGQFLVPTGPGSEFDCFDICACTYVMICISMRIIYIYIYLHVMHEYIWNALVDMSSAQTGNIQKRVIQGQAAAKIYDSIVQVASSAEHRVCQESAHGETTGPQLGFATSYASNFKAPSFASLFPGTPCGHLSQASAEKAKCSQQRWQRAPRR